MLVRIRNYRCVRDVGVELGGGLAVLLGPNGSGKTSFLEALFLGASGVRPLRLAGLRRRWRGLSPGGGSRTHPRL